METQQLHNIIESCLLVAGKAMSVAQLETLFDEDIDRPERSEIKEAMVSLQASYEGRGIELVEVSSGWRLQSAASMQHWVSRLFEERPPRYSRALLETLVLIAYRQPITRGEIEDVRGVAVSSNIIRTLQEREWIKEMGFKDVPGKPALWGTTKAFLDYFNLKRLDELPSLAEARDLAEIDAALAAEMGVVDGADDGVAANDEQGESVQGESVQGESVQGESAQGESALGENVQGDSAEGESTRGESVLGESSITDEPKLADLANSIDADDAITDEPKLGDLAKELEANSADTDEPELADLANSLEVESVDEPELADLAGALQEENTNALSLGDVANHLGANNNSDAALGFSDLANAHTNDLAGDQAGNSANDLEADSESSNKASDEASSEPPVLEATEISAFDLDIEQMPQTADKTDAATEASDSAVSANEAESQTNGSVAPSDTNSESSSNTSAGNGAEPDRGEAEADLRKVIDDFAEEHRKQLDDRNSHRATFGEGQNTTSGPSVDTRAVEETPEPLINGDDEQSVASAKLYGVHGSVDAEVDSADSDASEQLKGSDTDYGSSANSGDP